MKEATKRVIATTHNTMECCPLCARIPVIGVALRSSALHFGLQITLIKLKKLLVATKASESPGKPVTLLME